MSTIIPNISKPYLLDELLSSSNFTACLFTNNIVGDENPINFDEPTFEGYSGFQLTTEKWGISTLNVNYATCEYNEPILFTNYEENSTEQIYGYYVKNESGDILWYEKFGEPKSINSKETLIVALLVNLNKPGAGLNLVSIILKSSDSNTPVSSSSISLLTENWNGSPATGSLVDITSRGFQSNNSIFNFLLKSDVIPSESNTYDFAYIIESYGFNNLSTSSSVSNVGVTIIEKTLDPIFPPPTTPPETLPPEGELITLYGPMDTKVGVTLRTATEDSNLIFTYIEDSVYEFPGVTLIYINDIQVAHVDHFNVYFGKPFIFNYQSYTLNGVFQPNVYFYVAPPGPDFPEPG